MVIFSLDNRGKKRVLVSNYVPSSLGEEAFIDRIQVPNSKTSIFLRLAVIFPGSKSNRIGGIVILNTSQPESSNDGIDFTNESHGEQDRRHVVHQDRSKN